MILKNEFFTINIASHGAELKSIKNANGNEYLWQADPKFWAKTSPILFPIVGGLKNNRYTYNHNEYILNRHGFARDNDFTIQQTNELEGTFTLKANTETLNVYPFLFELTVHYKLEGNELFCTYSVSNLDSKPMPFSIGAHPAFSFDNVDITHYFLEFANDTYLNRLLLTPEGLISENVEQIKLENKELHLSKEIFYKDALVFRDLKSGQITLKNKTNKQSVTMSFTGFSHFGIWSAPNSPFICLEPWCGIADLHNHNGVIEQKEGIIHLASKQTAIKQWSIKLS